MTETLLRPGREGGAPAGARPPRPPRRTGAGQRSSVPWLAAAFEALGAVVLALVAVEVVVLLAWAADSRAGAGASEALRVGASTWLAGLHVRVHAGPGVVGLPPLGITLLSAALVARAADGLLRRRSEGGQGSGRWSREALVVIPALVLPYGVTASVLAAVVATPALHPSPATALVGGTAVALAGAGAGLLRARRRDGAPPLLDLLPATLATATRGGLAALAALTLAAALLGAITLGAHADAAARTSRALLPGAIGGVALLLLEVCLVPNVVLSCLSWLAGPGFAVGQGTSVTPWGTTLGRVPALPLLAGLPSGPHGPGAIVLLLPLAAGAAGGLVVAVRHGGSWRRAAALGGATGPVAGLLAALACYAAGGPVGAGRLQTVGPSGWRVGLAVLLEVGVPAALTAAAVIGWRARGTGKAAAAGQSAGQ